MHSLLFNHPETFSQQHSHILNRHQHRCLSLLVISLHIMFHVSVSSPVFSHKVCNVVHHGCTFCGIFQEHNSCEWWGFAAVIGEYNLWHCSLCSFLQLSVTYSIFSLILSMLLSNKSLLCVFPWEKTCPKPSGTFCNIWKVIVTWDTTQHKF
jgi:hypothetical protein